METSNWYGVKLRVQMKKALTKINSLAMIAVITRFENQIPVAQDVVHNLLMMMMIGTTPLLLHHAAPAAHLVVVLVVVQVAHQKVRLEDPVAHQKVRLEDLAAAPQAVVPAAVLQVVDLVAAPQAAALVAVPQAAVLVAALQVVVLVAALLREKALHVNHNRIQMPSPARRIPIANST